MRKIASLSIVQISGNRYLWTISGLSSPFNISNYRRAGITLNSFSDGTESLSGHSSTSSPETGTSTSVSGEFFINESGTFKFYGFAQALNGKYYTAGSATVTHTIKIERPSDFSWIFPKVSGGNFNVSADEWFNFQIKINAFRRYKGLEHYGFTSVTSGQSFQAYLFRQAANAIYEISSNLGVAEVCRNVQSGDTIYAWYFTNLSTALNNIT